MRRARCSGSRRRLRAWDVEITARSRPFDPPASGKIAVQVINHYGDEVLKVYAIEAPS